MTVNENKRLLIIMTKMINCIDNQYYMNLWYCSENK